VKEITSNKDFNEVIQQDKPVLLDFYAEWCDPCQVMLPTIEKIAKEFEGKIEVRKINIDENRPIVEKCKIKSIPALYFIKNGQIFEKIYGMTSDVRIKKQLSKLLK